MEIKHDVYTRCIYRYGYGVYRDLESGQKGIRNKAILHCQEMRLTPNLTRLFGTGRKKAALTLSPWWKVPLNPCHPNRNNGPFPCPSRASAPDGPTNTQVPGYFKLPSSSPLPLGLKAQTQEKCGLVHNFILPYISRAPYPTQTSTYVDY